METCFLLISHNIWEHSVCIECDEYWIIEGLSRYFNDFVVVNQHNICICSDVKCMKNDCEGYDIYVKNRIVQKRIPQELVIGMIIEIVSSALILKNGHLTFLHGGAVQLNNITICLIGESHSGKTSLLLSMLSYGWNIGHDDICPVDVKNAQYQRFFMPLMVRDNGYIDLSSYIKVMNLQTYNMKTHINEIRKIISIPEQNRALSGQINCILHLSRDEGRKPQNIEFQKLENSYAAKILALNNRDPINPRQVIKDSLGLARKIPVYHVEYGDAIFLAKYIDEKVRQ